MATLHVSEAELAQNLHAALTKVQQGAEIVIEHDHQPIAVFKPSSQANPNRKLSELAKESEARLGFAPTPDAGFAHDVQAGIDARRDAFEPPAWD